MRGSDAVRDEGSDPIPAAASGAGDAMDVDQVDGAGATAAEAAAPLSPGGGGSEVGAFVVNNFCRQLFHKAGGDDGVARTVDPGAALVDRGVAPDAALAGAAADQDDGAAQLFPVPGGDAGGYDVPDDEVCGDINAVPDMPLAVEAGAGYDEDAIAVLTCDIELSCVLFDSVVITDVQPAQVMPGEMSDSSARGEDTDTLARPLASAAMPCKHLVKSDMVDQAGGPQVAPDNVEA